MTELAGQVLIAFMIVLLLVRFWKEALALLLVVVLTLVVVGVGAIAAALHASGH